MNTPWPALLTAAMSLGIAPATFWRLSVREWRAIAAPSAATVLSRVELEALARAYPDRRHD